MPPSPPPAAFPFLAGNFDFPHASVSPPPPLSPPRITRSSAATLRNFQRAAARELDQSHDRAAAELEAGSRALRRVWARRTIPPREREPPPGPLPPQPRRLPPPSTSADRPRATPSERYLRRSHARLREQRSADMDAANALGSLSGFSSPGAFGLLHASTRPRSPAAEAESSQRVSKRRKIEHGANAPPPWDGFKYGYKGQVVPGRLKMEITTCDGGEYEKYTSEGLYKVQNVLKNDKSVYCSERPQCNLLLKHIGEMPFVLEKLVIKAPDRGFTAPVQEGLIFVSMSAEELIAGTADYRIEYGSPSPRLSPSPSSSSLENETLSLREAIDDPYIWEHSRPAMEEAVEDRIERLRLRSRQLQMEANRERRRDERRTATFLDNFIADNCEFPNEDSHATAAGISAPTPPPFTVTTESGDDESDENEELPSAAIMADRMRRESRWRPESDDEEDDPLSPRYPPNRFENSEYLRGGRWRPSRYSDPIRATRLRTPSRIEPTDHVPETEGLTPHAKFFIAKNKNKITIKFHPAVSGKHILLKLWSPVPDGNIDIESVQFYGFSGPRFFPAVQPR
ncbi:hypothetical protein P154DRAFT_45883 [Amniculicola lignicola CBS 123094]|uniref:Uncharacterized protein n=1 Tax=Amniculicola lignicola CBS 123094 TaxID=1392246 RepID=A0A6A5WS52_9PLEO|nr:hypothetical protein P154DRAFT_45883 [Amniculicola lignicola CBS 123094]